MCNDFLELSKLSSKKLKELLNEKPNIVSVMPFGAIEQHGPHLPLGTDSIGANIICKELCKKISSLYVPTTDYGVSAHHLGWAGTVALSQEVYSNLIMEVITNLYNNGLRRFLWINHHNGNIPTLLLTKQKLMLNLPEIQIAFPSPPHIADRKYLTLDIHAGKAETDFMLTVAPNLVDKESIPIKSTEKLPAHIRSLLGDPGNHIKKILLDACLPLHTSKISKDGIVSTLSPAQAQGESKAFIENWIEFLKKLIIEWEKLPMEY